MSILRIFKEIYSRIYVLLFVRPFMKQCGTGFRILSPILITPKCLQLGDNVFIRNAARIEGVFNYRGIEYTPSIIFCDFVSIEQNFHLTCAKKIIIGKNTAIAANVTITDIDHPYQDISMPPERQPITVKEVFIGEDCKIYNNVVILPGITIGKHCVIGANSVVNKDIPDYCIAVGAPAKIIKRYNFDNQSWQKTNSKGKFI